MEWQLIDENNWVFGEKVRGVVRFYHGEVYYDEGWEGQEGGWVWLVTRVKDWGDRGMGVETFNRGRCGSLQFAIAEAEKALGVS